MTADAVARDHPDVGLLAAAGVSASAVLLFGVHARPLGHVVLVVALVLGFVAGRELGKDLLLFGLGLAIISTTSVEADLDWGPLLRIGAVLLIAVVVPFAVDRWVYRRRAIRFPWRTGERWPTVDKWYMVAVPVIGWLVLPWYFIRSGAYVNWPSIDDAGETARFFVGVNAVGTWDELFFRRRRCRS